MTGTILRGAALGLAATGAAVTLARAQGPASPAGYEVAEIAFDVPMSEGVRLACTLTTPNGEGPYPAAVLITGAGPHDRDSTNAGRKPFAALADHLSSHGVAVLRCDDRGVGGSTGDLATASWLDLAADADAGAAFLRTRAQIDPEAIGVIGHSLGGIVAPIAAADGDDFDFLVSLAGPSTDFIALTLGQRRRAAVAQGAPEEVVARTEPVLADAFAAVAAASSLEEARESVRRVLTAEALAQLGAPEAALEALVGQIASQEMFIATHHEPQKVLPRVHVPVLALAGTLDPVVDADENLAAIEAALPPDADVTTVKLEGLNHFFQTAVTGDPSEYAELEEDFAPKALEAISQWIGERYGVR